MKIELNEKDIYALIMILDSEIRDTRKNSRNIREMENKENLCLVDALEDRAKMLEGIKEKLQNVE